MKFIRLSKAVFAVALAATLLSRESHGQDLMALPIAGPLLVAESPAAYKPDPDAEANSIEDSLFQISQFPVLSELESTSGETAAIPGKGAQSSEKEEEGGILSLMQRFSLASTYLDATEGANTKTIESRIKEAAPSELRVTLFSIELGD